MRGPSSAAGRRKRGPNKKAPAATGAERIDRLGINAQVGTTATSSASIHLRCFAEKSFEGCHHSYLPNSSRQLYCRACRSGAKRDRDQKWAIRNRDKIRAQRLGRYAKNPEKFRAKARAFYASNRERILATLRAERAGKPRLEKNCFRCGRAYVPTGNKQRYCPECKSETRSVRAKAYLRKYRRTHQKKLGAYGRRYYRANRRGCAPKAADTIPRIGNSGLPMPRSGGSPTRRNGARMPRRGGLLIPRNTAPPAPSTITRIRRRLGSVTEGTKRRSQDCGN